jgi:hypothetical protein
VVSFSHSEFLGSDDVTHSREPKEAASVYDQFSGKYSKVFTRTFYKPAAKSGFFNT